MQFPFSSFGPIKYLVCASAAEPRDQRTSDTRAMERCIVVILTHLNKVPGSRLFKLSCLLFVDHPAFPFFVCSFFSATKNISKMALLAATPSTAKSAPGKQCPDLKTIAAALKMSISTTASDCCQWEGVVCNNGGYVTELIWFNEKATGYIPDDIQKLMSLEHLDLSSNRLAGNVPGTLNQLTKLTWLDLHNNTLIGKIPPTLGQLPNLKTVYLSNNQIGGEIPDIFGSLQSLTGLQLNDNKFTGHIPPTLGKLSRLNDLILYNNYFDGPIPELFASTDCMLFPQKNASSMCYAGATRAGKCYDKIAGYGIKNCLTSTSAPSATTIVVSPPTTPGGNSAVVPIIASIAGLLVAVAIGVLLFRLRQSTTASKSAAHAETHDQSLLSPTAAVDMDAHRDLVADEPWRQTGMLPGCKDAPIPMGLDMLNTFDRMELPAFNKGTGIAVHQIATDTDFAADSLILPADGHQQGVARYSIDLAAGAQPMAYFAPHGETDSDVLLLPGGGSHMVGYAHEPDEDTRASRPLF
ncbi:hypothetical protein BC828DRAFT_18173 [Blastocladiella britannica]|nr:hypothetical protein BC828DRAFT_18173 [Blastocladiella britannica]